MTIFEDQNEDGKNKNLGLTAASGPKAKKVYSKPTLVVLSSINITQINPKGAGVGESTTAGGARFQLGAS
jgi:hypothetical protein